MEIDAQLATWRDRRLDAATDQYRAAARRQIDALLDRRLAAMVMSPEPVAAHR
jgi:hypothetical protein